MDRNVYDYMAEIADRRSKKYLDLDKHLNFLCKKHGKESVQVKNFFALKVDEALSKINQKDY